MSRTLVSAIPGRVGEQVRIEGWVARVRALGGLTFVILRERTGSIQAILERGEWPNLTSEAVVAIEGKVVENPRAPGGYEILATQVEVLNQTHGQLPVEVSGTELGCGPEVLVEQRVLTMRHPKQAAIFKVQAAIVEGFTAYLRSEGFLEIFTPKLIATGTEGGSELFSVPYFGRQAFLAQSPQLYKEMLVASGAERVFEVGHVYRAEPHETSRHLSEYVSLDVEVGFIQGEEELMALETALLRHIFAHLAATCEAELMLWGGVPTVPAEIPRVTYAEACERVGELSAQGEKSLCQALGSELVFVTAFPATERPFYAMPVPGAPHLTKTFDLVYRGLEITSGGQRLHALPALEASMVAHGMSPEAFGAYREAFKHGMPPHGGFAIGLERLTARVLGLGSVREASLFPRTRNRLAP
ncbi:MAG: aspartate--tRNA(Asn) ligase [Cyanobacteria bacterium RYN_339]|nr:aspartate--tRNA(Asn) ligase [Cyanobacteria bacterium RYN_339]